MVWAQLGAIMSSKVLVMFLGCATTSAAAGFLGKTYWNVWDLYLNILLQFWSPEARAGITFVSLGMMLSVIATNAGTNSLPVGADCKSPSLQKTNNANSELQWPALLRAGSISAEAKSLVPFWLLYWSLGKSLPMQPVSLPSSAVTLSFSVLSARS